MFVPPTEQVFPNGCVTTAGRIEHAWYSIDEQEWWYYCLIFHPRLISTQFSSGWVAQRNIHRLLNDGEHLPSIPELRLQYRITHRTILFG